MPLTAVVILKLLTFLRLPQFLPGSLIYTFSNNPRKHEFSQVKTIDRFKYTVKKLIRALKKINVKNKTENFKLKITKHVKAEKLKIRISKLKYKLVDEMYVGLFGVIILLTFFVQLK